MFGSSPQHRFLAGRQIVLEMPLTVTASAALKSLSDFMASYEGNKDDLRFGYWDYGEALVIAAPTEEIIACPVHIDGCDWCYGTGRVTVTLGKMLLEAKKRGEIR